MKPLRFAKQLSVFLFVGMILWWGTINISFAQENMGVLEIIGVPEDVLSGRYDTSSGKFIADVVDIDEAYVRMTYNDIVLTGKVLEWHIKEKYLVVSVEAVVITKDMEINSQEIRYYTDKSQLEAEGDVQVVWEEATIKAAKMTYLEESNQAEFVGTVQVTVEDGVFSGERFVVYVDRNEMEFIGPFRGEFTIND